MGTVSNRRVARNTVILYFRMLLTMAVSLYASRVVLQVLGASDYGLYNVVGGVVTMLSFLNGSLSAGTSRFISYALGVGNNDRLSSIFNVALTCHIGIALAIFIIAETAGLWFVNTQMVFPPDRTFAVNVVYQLTIITAMLSFTQAPFTADIIAHEQMTVYAYGSIGEASLKLGMVLLLKVLHTPDALITYALMIFIVQTLIMLFYRYYCIKHYLESKWKFIKDKSLYKEILSFSGWDIIGNLTIVTQGQGVNILLNIYFGPVVNAARAIAYQVQGAFQQFSSNFMMAVNPQIIKSYSRSEKKEMVQLINNSSLFAFFLLLTFIMPVFFKLDTLLGVWLGEYPEYTHDFTILVLVTIMIRALANPVVRGTHATGDIKSLNIYAGILGLLPLPVAWLSFKIGYPAIMAFWIILIWAICANVVEILILKSKLRSYFSIRYHLIYVYMRCLFSTIMVMIPVYYLNKLFGESFIQFIIYYGCSLIVEGLLLFFVGAPRELRNKIINIIKSKYAAIKVK